MLAVSAVSAVSAGPAVSAKSAKSAELTKIAESVAYLALALTASFEEKRACILLKHPLVVKFCMCEVGLSRPYNSGISGVSRINRINRISRVSRISRSVGIRRD